MPTSVPIQRLRPVNLLAPQVRRSSTESAIVSTISQQAEDKQAKKRAGVTFNETVAVRPISHFSNMTLREIRKTWYSHSEMTAIKRNLIANISDMAIMGQPKDSSEFTVRGLECRTRHGSKQRQENKLNAIEAVLQAQSAQRMSGISEPDGIRHAYLQHSERCLVLAQIYGVRDEIETLDYLELD